MMGLEKLLRGLYGSDPQLDMDAQVARARVPKPMTFDFAALADGIRRNNVGTSRIQFEATVVVKDGQVEIRPTGQRFPLSGPPPPEPGPARRRLKVLDWNDPAKTKVEILP